MDTLVRLQVLEAPAHPVLANAGRYDLRKLTFEWLGPGEAILVMELSTHDDYVTLRFEAVEDLHIDSGEAPSGIRIEIRDTSTCAIASHRVPAVRVGGVANEGLSFWAGSVVRVA